MSNDGLVHSSQISKALLVSADHLNLNKSIVDNLNVFPVPDGDTGSNMAGTFVPAVQLLQNKEFTSFQEIAEIILPCMNTNSRGNSGFILSSFFKGLFASIFSTEFVSTEDLAEGFRNGYYEVNSSLFNPVAGTMVTIIETMAKSISGSRGVGVVDSLDIAVKEARKVLFDTPKMLPILAKAGVIDSGALGFILVIEGLLLGLSNSVPKKELEIDYRFDPDPLAVDETLENIQKKQFCTEVTINKTRQTSLKNMKEYLMSMGDSIALIDDQDILKLHIHTDFPEQIIDELGKYGEISRQKIDDMYMQVSSAANKKEISQENCVLFFSPGAGFSRLFKELGVEHIIQYSNLLPSVGEISDILDQITTANVIVLPNNNNILPSCMAAADRSDKNILIIPTPDIIQGLACYYGYSENENIETNVVSMKECQHLTKALFLYKSSDDRRFGDTDLKRDDYFCLHNNDICSVEKDIGAALIQSLENFDLDEMGNITLFYKEDTMLDVLQKIETQLQKNNPQIEIELLFGGQHQAELIVALE